MEARDGIRTFGDLGRRIREGHGLQQQEVGKVARLDKSTISKIEKGVSRTDTTVCAYIKALGLSKPEEELLTWTFFYPSKVVTDREAHLAQIRFSGLRDRVECEHVRKALMSESNPAYIRDELWFVHAYNEALMELFRLGPSDVKGGWTAWHVMGTKYAPKSKLIISHGRNAETYFPKALQQFFEETGKFFFTPQMLALRNRLWGLSPAFQRSWKRIIEFNSPFTQLDHLQRDILDPFHYPDEKWISMALTDHNRFDIEVGDKDRIRYTMVVWIPYDTDARSVVERIRDTVAKGGRPQKLYFAANNTEEFNDWSELRTRVTA